MSKNTKELRGQVRQVVKELLDAELVRAVEEKLTKIVEAKLKKLEDRQNDIIGMMIRKMGK